MSLTSTRHRCRPGNNGAVEFFRCYATIRDPTTRKWKTGRLGLASAAALEPFLAHSPPKIQFPSNNRESFLILPGGSLYGWLRNWMGVEGISYLLHDDPALFGEMVRTAADCICGVLETTLRRGGVFDGCMIWEDMCFNKGPLISPNHIRQFLLPHYRRIVEVLHRHGVPHVMVDSDGCMDLTLPLWLEGGIDVFLPFEIGTTGSDPVEYRWRFGPGLRLIGGFDKRIMAAGRRAIEAEVDRLAPLVAQGGFLPCCDHKVPPDVTLENC